MPINLVTWSVIDARILRDIGQSASNNSQGAAADRKDWFNQGMLELAEERCFEGLGSFTCNGILSEWALPTDFCKAGFSPYVLQSSNLRRFPIEYLTVPEMISRNAVALVGGRPEAINITGGTVITDRTAPATGYVIKMPYFKTFIVVNDSDVISAEVEAIRKVECFVRAKIRFMERSYPEGNIEMAQFTAYKVAQAENYSQNKTPEVNEVRPRSW